MTLRRIWLALRFWRHRGLAVWTNRFIGGGRGEWWCRHCGGLSRAENVDGACSVTESTCPRWPSGLAWRAP